ncbi:tRNA-queuosine alpha-mannosyltransferase domain-containing protein [Marinobacterium sp. YM272]|uniref:tRNA-queuosine alpha-mannosyltransferase domain-containing protein n=1 Tax=Marinobacterium sp. YM272 TaxID=3421654 RepID=UPI003D7FCCFE
MRILLLSAYDAASHRAWRKGLVNAFPEHDWTELSLPARYFSWRIRGNSLSWAFSERELLSQPYDLVVATSMVDLTSLRGFVPSLGQIPTLVYFHENQFAYPESGREFRSVEPQLLNIYNALCADRVLFNSHYNRNTLLQGAKKLLAKLPDQVPPGLIEQIEAHSSVVPVPLPDSAFERTDSANEVWPQRSGSLKQDDPIRIVWAARWEFDKGPDRLLAILRELEARGTDFRLCILGERFRNSPKEFDLIAGEFSHRLDQCGYAESREAYLGWLRGGDILLSTATHEFQGLSVLEAVAQGCIPALPARQVYPELFTEAYLYRDCGKDIQREAGSAADLIERQAETLKAGAVEPASVAGFSWSALKPRYAELFCALTSGATE